MNNIRTATRLDADDVFSEALSHLGEALYALRMLAGLSQTELAEAICKLTGLKTDQSTISRIEQGKNRYLDWFELFAVCRVLDCSPDHLFEHALQIVRNLRGLQEGRVSGDSLLKEVSTDLLLEKQASNPITRLVARQSFHNDAEKVYRYLRKRILLGDFLNGEIISSTSIKKEFSASLSSVVQAFHLLQADGCVTVLGEKTCIVPEYSIRYMVEIVCRRIEIEAKAATAISKLRSPKRGESIAELKGIHEKMLQLGSRLRVDRSDASHGTLKGEFTEYDIDFHLAMLKCAGHDKLLSELKRLVVQVLVGTQTMAIEARPQEVLDEHSEIISAIEGGKQDEIVNSLTNHMIGNARQWENILRDRLDSTPSTSEADVKLQEHRFMMFKNQVTERRSQLSNNL